MKLEVRALGQAVMALGGERTKPADPVDPRVGLPCMCGRGMRLRANDAQAQQHAATPDAAAAALRERRAAITTGDAAHLPTRRSKVASPELPADPGAADFDAPQENPARWIGVVAALGARCCCAPAVPAGKGTVLVARQGREPVLELCLPFLHGLFVQGRAMLGHLQDRSRCPSRALVDCAEHAGWPPRSGPDTMRLQLASVLHFVHDIDAAAAWSAAPQGVPVEHENPRHAFITAPMGVIIALHPADATGPGGVPGARVALLIDPFWQHAGPEPGKTGPPGMRLEFDQCRPAPDLPDYVQGRCNGLSDRVLRQGHLLWRLTMPSTQTTKPRSAKKAPGTTAPPVAEPQESAPPVAKPRKSAPPVAKPQESAPTVAEPQESAPPAAEPQASAPPETAMGDAEKREVLIRIAAYSFYERRGYVSGNDLEDWLQAEMEVNRQMAAAQEPTQKK